MRLSSIKYYQRIEALHSLFNYIPNEKWITLEELCYIVGLKRTATRAIMTEMSKIFPIEYKNTKGYRYKPENKPFIYKSIVGQYLEKMSFWDIRIQKIKREEKILRERQVIERNKQIKSLKETLIYNHK